MTPADFNVASSNSGGYGKAFACQREAFFAHAGHFDDHVFELFAERDGAVAGQRSMAWSSRDDGMAFERFDTWCGFDGKAHIYRRRRVIVVLDLGVGQRGLFHD